jgi:hypothetical protein
VSAGKGYEKRDEDRAITSPSFGTEALVVARC